MKISETVFYDLETGGTRWNDEIIQIGAVCGDDEFEVKLQFDIDNADAEALEMNSFDYDLWINDAIPLEEGLDKFSSWLSDHAYVKKISKKKGKEYWVARLSGYNIIRFDGSFLYRAYNDLSMFRPWDQTVYDVMQLARWCIQDDSKSFKLIEVAKHLGINLDNINAKGGQHDAVWDAMLTRAICYELMPRCEEDMD